MRHIRCQGCSSYVQHSSFFEVYTSDLTISVSTDSSTSIAAEVRSELVALEERRECLWRELQYPRNSQKAQEDVNPFH
jgi:hypothetical protein